MSAQIKQTQLPGPIPTSSPWINKVRSRPPTQR
jgi:hypothetical protein